MFHLIFYEGHGGKGVYNPFTLLQKPPSYFIPAPYIVFPQLSLVERSPSLKNYLQPCPHNLNIKMWENKFLDNFGILSCFMVIINLMKKCNKKVLTVILTTQETILEVMLDVKLEVMHGVYMHSIMLLLLLLFTLP